MLTNNNVMSIEDTRRTQRPYRYGMILLCCGALINWLGLSESYAEPVRYVGVGCIIVGALLICSAMCCWLHIPQRTANIQENIDEPIHVITIASAPIVEKPPAYETIITEPPTYDDAIKLNPNLLNTISPDVFSKPSCSRQGSLNSSPTHENNIRESPR